MASVNIDKLNVSGVTRVTFTPMHVQMKGITKHETLNSNENESTLGCQHGADIQTQIMLITRNSSQM